MADPACLARPGALLLGDEAWLGLGIQVTNLPAAQVAAHA